MKRERARTLEMTEPESETGFGYGGQKKKRELVTMRIVSTSKTIAEGEKKVEKSRSG